MPTESPKTVEINDSLLTCSLCVGTAILSFLGHLTLGCFYWIRTGTFPLKERVLSKISSLSKKRAQRHSDKTVELEDP